MKDKKIIPDKKSEVHERFVTDFLNRSFKSFNSLTKSKYHRDIMDNYYKTKDEEEKQESNGGGYMYQDGRPDDMEGCLLTNRCFVGVLGKILQENEGMVVKLPYQEKYPDDPYGKFIVHRHGGLILITECGADEQKFEDGQWLWLDEEKPLTS